MNLRSGFLCLALVLCGATLVQAQNAPGPGAKPATEMPSVLTVPPEAQPSPHFSAEAATRRLPRADPRRGDCALQRLF